MTDGGYVVPEAFADEMLRVVRLSAFVYLSDEMLEDLGYPPRGRGLAYWQLRERQAIRAAHPMNRLRRRVRRVRTFASDVPRRLVNARAALAGEWERSDDDD